VLASLIIGSLRLSLRHGSLHPRDTLELLARIAALVAYCLLALVVGVYQCTYALKNVVHSSTRFQITLNIVKSVQLMRESLAARKIYTRLQSSIQRRRPFISQQPRVSVCTSQSQNPDLSHFCEMAGIQELVEALNPLKSDRLQSTFEYRQFVPPVQRLQDTHGPNQMHRRDLYDFQRTLTSMNG
jgi:hypothetical protein